MSHDRRAFCSTRFMKSTSWPKAGKTQQYSQSVKVKAVPSGPHMDFLYVCRLETVRGNSSYQETMQTKVLYDETENILINNKMLTHIHITAISIIDYRSGNKYRLTTMSVERGHRDRAERKLRRKLCGCRQETISTWASFSWIYWETLLTTQTNCNFV